MKTFRKAYEIWILMFSCGPGAELALSPGADKKRTHNIARTRMRDVKYPPPGYRQVAFLPRGGGENSPASAFERWLGQLAVRNIRGTLGGRGAAM